MGYINPTIDDFKSYFIRDFPYGTTPDQVMDNDIVKALNLAAVNFNQCLWGNQNTYTIGFLLLSAHFLQINLQASSQGLSGQYSWLVSSKSVGSVSEGLTIPDRILANPEFAMLSKTRYGAEYLFLLLPQLAGQMFSVPGRTHA